MHSLWYEWHSPVAMAGEILAPLWWADLILEPGLLLRTMPGHTMPCRGQQRLPTLRCDISFPLIYRRHRATLFCCVKETHTSGFSLSFFLYSLILGILSMPCTQFTLEVVSISHLGCYFQGMVIWLQHLFRAATGQKEVSVQKHLPPT